MLPVGFEPIISAGKRPKTYALDSAATGTGIYRVSQEERTIFWEVIVSVILSKNFI
jgi:hypothetical protein